MSNTSKISENASDQNNDILSSDQNTSPRYDHAEYDEAFERTGYGKFNCLATFACSLIFIHSLLEMLAIAYIITPAKCDLHLNVEETSIINSAAFIGIMLTAICWGVLGDLYGRRRIMLPGVLGAIASSLISSFSFSFRTMFFFRFLTGMLISVYSAMVLVYLAELQPAKYRDRNISIAISASQISFILLPVIAWTIIPHKWTLTIGPMTVNRWRVFMWTWSAVGLLGAIILFILPESPRFIAASKRPDAALPILAKMYAINNKKKATDFSVKVIDVNTAHMERKTHLLQNLSQMMKVPIRRCVILTHTAMFVSFTLSNGLYIWLPDIINFAIPRVVNSINMCKLINEKNIVDNMLSTMQGTNSNDTEPFKDHCLEDVIVNWKVYPMAMAIEIFYLGPFITVISLIEKFDKCRLYAFIMLVCAVALVLCSLVPQCVVSLCFFIIGLANGSCCCILTALVVDSFPTSLRGLATCTLYMSGQLGAVVGTSIIDIMIDWYCYLVFFVLAFTVAASGLSMVLFWPNIQDVRKIMESKHFSY